MEPKETLFPIPERTVNTKSRTPHESRPRLRSAERNHIEFKIGSLDQLIPPDHKVRDVFGYVEQLDLSKVLCLIQSVEYGVGRPATDPKILLALWLYSVLEGIVSARTIADLCSEHIAYQWICGGVKINHHTLSDFAKKHGEQFDNFLTQSIAILQKEGFVDLANEDVAQDGMRVRANAGTSSFRREKTLQELYKDAEEYVTQLKQEHEKNSSASRSRKDAAVQRAAKNRKERIGKAIEQLNVFREEKKKALQQQRKNLTEEKSQEMRTSITDSEARVMKMPCGGYRPAFNVQFATTTKNKIIVGVAVNNHANDAGSIEPMVQQIVGRCGCLPENMLVDAGYVKHSEVDRMAEIYPGCRLYMPVKVNPKSTKDPHSPLPEDSKPVADWKVRMGTDEAKERYKQRISTAEFSNAQSRNKDLQQFHVRGIEKVTIVGFIFAIVHNMQRLFSLRKLKRAAISV